MEHSENAQINPLATGKIPSLLLKFAVPSIIAMLVSALYNLVDQIFIGHGVGMLGNGATNVAFPLVTICVATALLFGTGGAAGFNLSMGAQDPERAKRIAGNAIFSLIASGIIITVLVLIFLEPLLLAFGSTPEVLPYAVTYTGITSLGIPFLILSTGMSHLIRADGSPRYSMACMIVGAVINTILDPLFIFVFDMGIAGAAWATIIGQAVSALVALHYVFRYKTVKLTRDCFRPSASLIFKTSSLGMASCVNQIAMLLVQIALNNSLTYYGQQSIYGADIPLACAGIIIKVNMICFSFLIGLSQASQPIISYNYGARQYARVRETFKLAAIMATVIAVIGFICFQTFPRQIISVFGEGDEQYFRFAEQFFRIFLFFTFINGIQPLTSGFFTSIGKAVKGIIISLTRQIVFLLPLIVILGRIYGIEGIMYAGPVADFTAFVLASLLVLNEFRSMRETESQLAYLSAVQQPE